MPFWSRDSDDDDWTDQREALVDRLEGRIDDETALDALRTIPRHEFVPENHRRAAYHDRPLPIGEGQTISAPHMVGIMLEELDLEPGQQVLEIGTGWGYHAALTAEIVGPENVYSVEYHQSLASKTQERFERLGYSDISVRVGDGHEGWPEHAPFDRSYLTCAAASFPDAVIEQLREGGILLGPIGRGRQTLVKAIKRADGTLKQESHGPVRFVQMRGGT